MKIICLVSPMGAGKDTILKEVIKEYNINPLISYTDRPIRKGETNGVEYNFVTEEEIYRMMHNGEFIETRVYNTEFGEWVYGLAKNSIDLYSKDNYIVILDFKGLISLREYLVNADKEDCLKLAELFFIILPKFFNSLSCSVWTKHLNHLGILDLKDTSLGLHLFNS